MSDSLGALKLTCSHPSTGDLATEGKWLEQWGEMSNEGTHFPAPVLLCQPPPACLASETWGLPCYPEF